HSALMAMDLTGQQALKGGADAQLVRIAGLLHSSYTRGQNEVLVLESADHINFEAVIRRSAVHGDLPAIGSMIGLTGICSVKTGDIGLPERFEIVLRDSNDLHVISGPAWLTTSRAFKALLIVAALAISGIVWVFFLRRQVRRQTTVIERDLQAKATLKERCQRIFQRNITGLYVAHENGSIIDCNDACARILGFASREDLLDNCEAADKVTEQFHLVAHSESLTEHRFQRRDGTWAWALTSARLVENGDGGPVLEGALLDITDQKLAADRIQSLAYYDSLTSLPNRSLLQDRLSHSLAGARRRKEHVGLLFLGVDAFKTINDSLGHSQGDLLLKAIAERLRLCAREQDTVARLGGDVFVMVVDGVKDPAEASRIAERVFRDMSTGFTIGERTFNVTCSVGISMFPEHGEDAETLIKNGDAAMFSAKEAGRNTFRFFTTEMTAQAMERLTLENNLRSAMKNNEFFIVYQPEFEIASGKIACCEALLRWKHPEAGMISPDRFIPIAESTGMIIPIGEWVLRNACEQAKAFLEFGMISGPMAVNVSAVQIKSEGFCSLLRKVLTETGLPAQFLELEITESLLLSRDESVFALLNELKTIGVSLAIDDFGTGYSSLGYLKQFPVNKLKIDRSFIVGIGRTREEEELVGAVLQMAQALHLKVTAEGVETDTQLNFLRSLGCDQVQGFLLCKPVPSEEFVAASSLGFRYFLSTAGAD
ncbi:MAG TPA: EAL domain-containing protein, partial [Edaphobacter sp.]|nr:EAL domain-containing protein [Edaphobacter sp.]